jgi:hypothetical protein
MHDSLYSSGIKALYFINSLFSSSVSNVGLDDSIACLTEGEITNVLPHKELNNVPDFRLYELYYILRTSLIQSSLCLFAASIIPPNEKLTPINNKC